jgi:hypothetical protein
MKISIYTRFVYHKITHILLFIKVILPNCKTESANFSESALSQLSDTIRYLSEPEGHLQGMITVYDTFHFWSHTTQVVRTDLNGNMLKTIDVPTRYGDLAYYNRKAVKLSLPSN